MKADIQRPVVLAYMLDDDAIEVVIGGPASDSVGHRYRYIGMKS